ncbi:MAG: 3'-5' exonuclease [Crocinitomicaceae bacterium]|jgi:DNA polymerase-3 subunit epsilon|tara:strand:- start:21166 stop:22002 length:837 start_codon:yes stop_codon:yes gene_type:complete
MNIKLKNPLCVFDLETTGLQITKDRIVQIAILKVHPDSSQEELNLIVNPEMNIPQEVIDIHGITNETALQAPTFKEVAQEVKDFIGDSDLAGFNSNKFDIPVLAEEFLRVGLEFDLTHRSFIDVQNIFHKMEQRTLVAAYKFYCEKELKNAHDAMHDTKATWEVLEKQLDKYDIGCNVTALADFSRAGANKVIDMAGRIALNSKNQVIYNFGKHKGKTIEEISINEPGYYGWMLEADFPLYTKSVLRKAMNDLKEKRRANSEKNMGKKLDDLQKRFNS